MILTSGTIQKRELTVGAFYKDMTVLFLERETCILGEKGYLSAKVQFDLFNMPNIELEVPYRLT